MNPATIIPVSHRQQAQPAQTQTERRDNLIISNADCHEVPLLQTDLSTPVFAVPIDSQDKSASLHSLVIEPSQPVPLPTAFGSVSNQTPDNLIISNADSHEVPLLQTDLSTPVFAVPIDSQDKSASLHSLVIEPSQPVPLPTAFGSVSNQTPDSAMDLDVVPVLSRRMLAQRRRRARERSQTSHYANHQSSDQMQTNTSYLVRTGTRPTSTEMLDSAMDCDIVPVLSRRMLAQGARKDRQRSRTPIYANHQQSDQNQTSTPYLVPPETSRNLPSVNSDTGQISVSQIHASSFRSPVVKPWQLPPSSTLNNVDRVIHDDVSSTVVSSNNYQHNCPIYIVDQTEPSILDFTQRNTFELGSSSTLPILSNVWQSRSSSSWFHDLDTSINVAHPISHGDSNFDHYSHDDAEYVCPVRNDGEHIVVPDLRIPSIPNVILPLERHFLGGMDVVCNHCSALHWLDEQLANSTRSTAKFGLCCLQGKIRLPLLSPLPAAFQSFYEDFNPLANSFRKNIRSYNASNSFTSLGVTIDDRILAGHGPTSFTIHGQLHHRIGSLLPEPNIDPVYAQLYVYDAHTALQYRTQRNPHLRSDVLNIINMVLTEENELLRVYKRASEILLLNNDANNEISVSLQYTPGTDPRRYNLPTTREIAVILPREGEQLCSTRDIILRLRSGPLRRISECHPAYWPLHYVLFFPKGDLGWHPEMKLWDVKNNCHSSRRLTQLQYYCYRLFERPTEYSSILRGGNLFQEFLVDAWAACEQNRLQYVRENQDQIRADCYQGLIDSMDDGLNASDVGRRTILPSSHLGSPRSMYEIYQDSMAITRHHHHPDIFLTATANPNWPEIQNELKVHQTAYDRPDLVARVFELKRKALMNEIVDKGVLGKVAAYVYMIEFQKRGLPHMHALIFLRREDKIRTPAQVDRIVSAELPDPKLNPLLFSTVITRMIHGPCGTRNPDAVCMVDNHGCIRCRSKYPKAFVVATLMDKDGYPTYMRSDTGLRYLIGGHEVDNRDVVPYNPHLSTMFDCHINVEVCASVRAVKYIHKYIYKGYDLTTLVVGNSNDEIQQYLDSRYIGPVEAAWHLFEFPMHKESPNVERLPLHLKGMHLVSFNSTDSPEVIAERAARQKSKLTAFFEYYRQHTTATKFTYAEFPQHFVWKKDKENSRWEPRQMGFAIGRISFVKPNEGERFYLRLLLTVVPGPSSFEALYQVGATVYSSYKDACIARGLLENNAEWDICLQEACLIRTGYQLRRLFAIILTECSPLYPDQLWAKYALQICDDVAYKLRISYNIQEPSDEQIKDYGLFLLDNLLLESGNTLSNYPQMPLPRERWCTESGNRLLSEQRQLRFEVSDAEIAACVDRLNVEQRRMYDAVTMSVSANEGKLFFLSGAAGTGKTYVYNTIADSCRRDGFIVIMVASSGIASLLLRGGRTAHSTFKLPLDLFDDSVCTFTKQSIHAELFKKTDLIIWDEVPMQHRNCIETVDRSLRDIRGNTLPFGGISVVFGGDFRQTLPVIPKGLREDIVGASVSKSVLWNRIRVLSLIRNVRLQPDIPENVAFSEFLTKVGTIPTDNLQLPADVYKCSTLTDLLAAVYPGVNVVGVASPSFLKDRTILAPRNAEVREINDAALQMFPGEYIEYLAADKAIEKDGDLPHITPTYPTDFLNGLDPSSLPPFRLRLKVGAPIMLLRNIAPRDGLCNGTRLIVEHCASRVIEARILTGAKAGETVFIPRISLSPTCSELPVPMTRRQFPVRLAFAMTINKSQGQSVQYIGIDLRTPVFSHGQLYVALSRCTSAKNISVILPIDALDTTVNIVYPEVLLERVPLRGS